MNLLQPEQAMDIVSNNNPDTVGVFGGGFANDLGNIVLTGVASLLPVLNIIGILLIVTSGMMLAGSQDDNQVAIARRVLIASSIGFVLINVAIPMKNALILIFGFDPNGMTQVQSGTSIINIEVLGVIQFIESIVAIVAILVIVISGIKAILSLGSDQGAAHMKRTVIAVLCAIALLVTKFVVVQSLANGVWVGAGADVVFANNPSALIASLVAIAVKLLSFVALVAVVMIVVAGIILVANKGDDQAKDQAKKIIGKVAIGMLLIVMSVLIFNFMILL